MEVIASLHGKLHAANAELEILQKRTDANKCMIEQAIQASNERLTHFNTTQENLVRRMSEYNTVVSENSKLQLEVDTLMEEKETFELTLQKITPRVLDRLEMNRIEQMKIKTYVSDLINDAAKNNNWLSEVEILQRSIIEEREKRRICMSGSAPMVPIANAPIVPIDYMRLIDEEENKLIATMEEIEDLSRAIEKQSQQLLARKRRVQLIHDEFDQQQHQDRSFAYDADEEYTAQQQQEGGGVVSSYLPTTSSSSYHTGYSQPTAKLVQHTLTRTVQYDTIEYDHGSTASNYPSTTSTRGSSSSSNIPWYKKQKVRGNESMETRGVFRTANQLLGDARDDDFE